MSTATTIAVAGATGRMGRRLIALADASHGKFRVAKALVRPGSGLLGKDAGEIAGVGPTGVPLEAELHDRVDCLIDFTGSDGARHWLKVCHQLRIPMLIGSTGLSAADHSMIDRAALNIPILQATNTSLGVAVMNHIAAEMARVLGDEFDIEVIELHHRHKKDAPSGTAMTLADHLLHATGRTRQSLVLGRESDQIRQPGQIPVHALRLGDVVGTHTVHFASEGERLELSHVATNRDVFASGALRAAAWLAGRGAGRYTMNDVLGVGGSRR